MEFCTEIKFLDGIRWRCLPFFGRSWSMLIPLVPASLACNQQTDVRMEGQGLREGKNAMLHLKRVASGMTPLSAKGKKGKTVVGWKAGRPRFLCVDRLGLEVSYRQHAEFRYGVVDR
jgi:hypothetical protein